MSRVKMLEGEAWSYVGEVRMSITLIKSLLHYRFPSLNEGNSLTLLSPSHFVFLLPCVLTKDRETRELNPSTNKIIYFNEFHTQYSISKKFNNTYNQKQKCSNFVRKKYSF